MIAVLRALRRLLAAPSPERDGWTPDELRELNTQFAAEVPQERPMPCSACGHRPGPLSLFGLDPRTIREQTRA